MSTHANASSMPKVTVCVVTYNQVGYIEACLSGLVAQEADFDFEVVVGDDCSTDGTREIVQEFARRYPGLVVPLLHEKNVGPYRNFIAVHELARGRYVAHVDGDDLVYPGKLQAQASLLDSRPHVAISAHAVDVIGKREVIGADPALPEEAGLETLLDLSTYFVHSSVMYRREHGFVAPPEKSLVDFYLYVQHAATGVVHLNRLTLGAYRLNPYGISKSAAHRERIETAYESAFDLALQLGCSEGTVHAARLKRRMGFAIARYLAGDKDGYRRKIALEAQDRHRASWKHRLLDMTRWAPDLVGVYAKLRGIQ